MGKLVQVRDVPEAVYRTLKSRAAQSGISLSEYLRGELALIASRPTPEEVLARLRQRTATPVGPSHERPAAVIRRARGR
jgi:plasmid stability protein